MEREELIEILSAFEIRVAERVEEQLDHPRYWNRTKIAKQWGYKNISQLKKWQLPDFGIPVFFNGISPMYKRSDVIEILTNPIVYKERWDRLSDKEKIKIEEQYQELKKRDEAMAC